MSTITEKYGRLAEQPDEGEYVPVYWHQRIYDVYDDNGYPKVVLGLVDSEGTAVGVSRDLFPGDKSTGIITGHWVQMPDGRFVASFVGSGEAVTGQEDKKCYSAELAVPYEVSHYYVDPPSGASAFVTGIPDAKPEDIRGWGPKLTIHGMTIVGSWVYAEDIGKYVAYPFHPDYTLGASNDPQVTPYFPNGWLSWYPYLVPNYESNPTQEAMNNFRVYAPLVTGLWCNQEGVFRRAEAMFYGYPGSADSWEVHLWPLNPIWVSGDYAWWIIGGYQGTSRPLYAAPYIQWDADQEDITARAYCCDGWMATPDGGRVPFWLQSGFPDSAFVNGPCEIMLGEYAESQKWGFGETGGWGNGQWGGVCCKLERRTTPDIWSPRDPWKVTDSGLRSSLQTSRAASYRILERCNWWTIPMSRPIAYEPPYFWNYDLEVE